MVLRFLERVSGYSRQHLTRLVKRGGERRPLIKRYCAPPVGFARTYNDADVHLLAQTDSLHGTLSGLATKKLMALGHPVERAFYIFGGVDYERLATLSVAHLYNGPRPPRLRRRTGYERHRQVWSKTRRH